jgi:hypothetical protein
MPVPLRRATRYITEKTMRQRHLAKEIAAATDHIRGSVSGRVEDLPPTLAVFSRQTS